MGKPILFDTISRSKFDGLDDAIKAKRNYQIKEENGSISKHIAGLEGVLPEVSTGDCGKAAIVDSSGNWVAAEISGGSGGDAEIKSYTWTGDCGINMAVSDFNDIYEDKGFFKVYCPENTGLMLYPCIYAHEEEMGGNVIVAANPSFPATLYMAVSDNAVVASFNVE